jgi:hypothetical protein
VVVFEREPSRMVVWRRLSSTIWKRGTLGRSSEAREEKRAGRLVTVCIKERRGIESS